jgi:hypothetical protein
MTLDDLTRDLNIVMADISAKELNEMEFDLAVERCMAYLDGMEREIAELHSKQVSLYKSLISIKEEFKLKEFDIFDNLKAQITVLVIQNEAHEITIDIFNRHQSLIDEQSKIIKFLNDLEHDLSDYLIKGQGNIIDKYQKGTKENSKLNQQKWELARKYFLEEIPNYPKKRNIARKVAAQRAGLDVKDRRLNDMLRFKK